MLDLTVEIEVRFDRGSTVETGVDSMATGAAKSDAADGGAAI